MELNKIIWELIAQNNFVSLPTLGSFIVQYQPAKLAADGLGFNPPKQVILFDTSRTFADDVIEKYLQETNSLSYSEASLMVKDFVDRLKQTLSNGTVVEFDKVGSLSQNSSGAIVFSPVDDSNRISSTFGLEGVLASPVAPKPKHTIKSAPKPIVKPIEQKQAVVTKEKRVKNTKTKNNTTLIIGIGAVAVILILAGLYFFVPELHFWNSKKIAEVKPKTNNNIQNQTKSEIVDTIKAVSSESSPAIESKEVKVEIVTDKKRALYYEEPKAPDNKTYYIIVGSFEKVENAKILQQKLVNSGSNSEILQSDGKYRVSLTKFSDKNRALRELERLRREKPNESAWILGL